ncbi:hypothetical protein Tco_0678969 [Tanacetum coccineum]|uniref:Uncharacterized protein n=1 Tax=Tanacetum coccineum TaxID=301880 RepID=A0ABQ4XHT6_9ASTR
MLVQPTMVRVNNQTRGPSETTNLHLLLLTQGEGYVEPPCDPITKTFTILSIIIDYQSREFGGNLGGQGRKPAKAEPSVHKDPLFDELADDTLDYMDTENAQDMGRTRFVVHEEKEREERKRKDVENIERPRLTSTRSLLTLKSLLKIDPKDKGKKKIKEDESDTESEDINETKKEGLMLLAHDEEITRKMQED